METFDEYIRESIAVKRAFVERSTPAVAAMAAEVARRVVLEGRTLFLFGNGGSAADAQHIAAELVNRFRLERPPFAALALTTDTSTLTSIGNDYSFDEVFAKQLRALGRPGDVALGLSTSGTSENVLGGLRAAREKGLLTVGFTGKLGGRMPELCDHCLIVPSNETCLIQETHIALAHFLCLEIDRLWAEKQRVEGVVGEC
jgi:D-sedoheptulose 7-phosphate isomerase